MQSVGGIPGLRRKSLFECSAIRERRAVVDNENRFQITHKATNEGELLDKKLSYYFTKSKEDLDIGRRRSLPDISIQTAAPAENAGSMFSS
mmetsp:Transcript_84813/g.226327  ORF Transcript_84813/g.226327 Transcript_84813/m.226327 type:complete len:91 (+) Transcript_84813:121-393(+)